jgi:predicted O-methyltransferase YrrM
MNSSLNPLIDKSLFSIHRSFLTYLLRADNAHGIHSPFVFALYQHLTRADNPHEPAFLPIEQARKALLQSRQIIDVTDFGAGPRPVGLSTSQPADVPPNQTRTMPRRVADMARRSLKPPRYGRLLSRLAGRFAGGGTVLELGTSLGLTTAYLATQPQHSARPARLITFEGCPETARLARQQFERLNLTGIEVVVGNLDHTLTPALTGLDTVDLVFFDANHRFEPTVRYFEETISKIHNDSVFVLDDIHWSAEMERAWATVQAHHAVTISIDLFGVGLLFFRREQPKQHFILRF